MQKPRVAIVADWLTNLRGGERVVLAIAKSFPGAPIYTSVYTPENLPEFKNLEVRTTYLQKFPKFLRKLHTFFPILRVRAFQKLDLSEFDLIISSSSAEAKQVRKTRPDQVHICYCHTPIRYYWSHYTEYKKDPGFGWLNPLVRLLMPLLIPSMRRADYKAAQNVDVFIANSTTVQERIKKYYHTPSIVIHPPVDVDRFEPTRVRDKYYVTISQQVPYKRIDLAVKAATKLGISLKVFGNGPEHEALKSIAGPTVSFFADRAGNASNTAIEQALNSAKGFIFPAEEDFGIVMVEALAGGAPVIGYAKGGTTDIVEDAVSGVLFDAQTVESLTSAIKRFETLEILPATTRRKAKRFDERLFIGKIQNIAKQNWPKS